jgi:acyl carrier protein
MDYRSIVVGAATRMNLIGPKGELLHVDSLAIVELVLALERATQLKIPNTALKPEVFASVDSIVAMLSEVAQPAA